MVRERPQFKCIHNDKSPLKLFEPAQVDYIYIAYEELRIFVILKTFFFSLIIFNIYF